MGDSLIAHLSYGFIIPDDSKKSRKLLTADIDEIDKQRIILDANQYDDEDYKFKYVPLRVIVSHLLSDSDVLEVQNSGNLWHGSAGAIVRILDPEIETFYEPMMVPMEQMENIDTESILVLEEFRDKYFPDAETGWIFYPSLG